MPSNTRTLVFSHANSFPASTYRTLFEGWREAGLEVHAIDKIGHDPRLPVTTDWPHLVTQLATFIEEDVGHPAWLVGHSLGGYLSMMVASRHPHLAQGVVALDSPLLHGWKSSAIAVAKRTRTMGRVMPSRISAQRTHEWPSLHAVQAHFSEKPKFARFDPAVLADYLRSGTEGQGDGRSRRLSFRRDVETAIYNTMPHALLQEFRRHPFQCPVAFIGGTHSRETRTVGLSGTRQVVGQSLSWIEGSHLYPFEHPRETVAEVLRWLACFEAEGPSP
jgi:pimeloyl-ACP methyl ester carboxylesterase